MAPKIDRWLEGYVTTLSEEKYSYQQIIKQSKNSDYWISNKSIYNVLYFKEKKALTAKKIEKNDCETLPSDCSKAGKYKKK